MNSDDELYEEDYTYCSDDGMLRGDADELKSYVVLKEDDIRNRQEDDITKISSLLFISRDAACILLSRHGWSPTRVEEEWFADEEGIRKAVGLLDKPVVSFPGATELVCGICFNDYPTDAIRTATCGHPFCVTCWTAYIRTSINDGPGCLNLRCPAVPKCATTIGADMIDMLASDQDKRKYRYYLWRSYIEDSKARKWCPAPGCDCAIEFDISSGGNYDVSCQCSYSFCWNCTEEVHRPVDCDTVSNWILKNSSEAENTTWIIANTKPCPRCRRPIEKNKGCMAMRCRPPCNFSFCWICLSSSSDHTGCNRFRDDGSLKEEERQRKTARDSLTRYTHYFERWAANDSSRKKALLDLHKMQRVCIQKVSQAQDLPETQMRFIVEAWLQIAECRRVLKWSYAYGYYNLTEEEKGKQEFFEYLQGEAEAGLERLHHCAENEVQNYLKGYAGEDFSKFRTKLIGLTKVTGTYFENLVRALENGLVDVNPFLPTSGL